MRKSVDKFHYVTDNFIQINPAYRQAEAQVDNAAG